MPDDQPANPEPSRVELEMRQVVRRLEALQSQGLTPEQALARLDAPEGSEEYLERNAKALRETEEFMLSPEYLARFEAAYLEPDETTRAQRLADLKREVFSKLDIQAIHRVIRARNRQMKAEGVLPPDAPV